MTIRSTFSCIMLFLFFGVVQHANAQLNVTVNKSANQQGVNSYGVGYFTAQFSAPIDVASFNKSDILLRGTNGYAGVNEISEISPWNGTKFEFVVSSQRANNVTASIPAAGYEYDRNLLGTTGSSPKSLVMDNAGNIYTANTGSNNISKISPNGSSTIFCTLTASPSCLIIDESGNLYASHNTANIVSKITSAGIATVLGTTGNNPNQLTRDASGNIYTANTGDATISKITPSGISTILGSTGYGPCGITIDSDGNLYTSNYDERTISKVTPDGTSSILCSVPSGCFYLTIDATNNLYVISSSDQNITKITPGGISSFYCSSGYFTGIVGITIDGSGNLFVAGGIVIKVMPVENTNQGGIKLLRSVVGETGGIVVDGIGNVYVTDLQKNDVQKLSPSGIALMGANIATNSESTSTDNIVVLPVTLLSFTAINFNCSAMLNWQTAAEVNNSYYAIEFSTNGTSFTQVAKQLSKNSATGANYTYTSNILMSANAYYRLKMVDIDGNYTYSKTVAVTAGSNCITDLVPNVSPNPASNFIVATGLVKGSHLSLINTNGTQLMAMQSASSSQRIDISPYAKGVYILRVIAADGTVNSLKFVKK